MKLLVNELSLIQSDRLINLLDDDVWVFADSDQVRQILWNLFNNAWEAGSEQVEISAYLMEAQEQLGKSKWLIKALVFLILLKI